ncbi:Ubiquitin supergroup [Penicillium expansum]|uniref:Ubiquitin supergroup n=1 Tax=Penicillium expansum TaxID=27334 RepID=A0A0A2IZJ7_PENEN|nr:Ubiquitin supergroup [Penicillium expansum]KGO38734.1 Ubiquitin supergroup [Penicillium expansum]KGO45560.1 Ubiquitin supergroup [Penicillium expansum]KGO54261.1 Ubiquitin supergroup [Penicillium expansum]
MATGLSSQPMVNGDKPGTITLHILCQSLPPPSRFTLENVPLSSTIAQLKGRIEQSFPNNPQASHQRLIYRGKPLTVDDATLRAVVSSMEEGIDSMHLVLPPEPTHAAAPPASEMPQHLHLGNSAQASTSSSTWVDDSNPDPSVTTASMSSHSSIPRETDATSGSPRVTFNQYVNASSFNRHSAATNAPEAYGAETSQRIFTLRRHIEEIEGQLDRRIMPCMENIILIRNQLLEIQDARPARQLPIPGVAELVARILDSQQRARLMEFMQQQHSQPSVVAQTATRNTLQAGSIQLFMLSSPMGDYHSGLLTQNHHLVSRPATQRAGAPNPAVANEPGAPQTPQVPPAPQPPNQNAAVVQNALRQAILNQERRGNNVEHAGLARHIRRIWLFTRLWLFCYLTSAPGTWRRYIFVSIALLVAFFSETNIPRQFATTIISPIQRHLEGLTHVGGPADRATQTGANDAAAEFNIWDQIRRAERAIVFLFASLVPGLGERHVQARTAADQAFLAEQERQARERQEQEQARERERQEQERAQASVVEDTGNAGTEQE